MAEDRIAAAQVVLKKVMERALEEAREASAAGNSERLQAFVELLSWAKLQAEVLGMPPFANRELRELDPEALLVPQRKAPSQAMTVIPRSSP